MSAEHCRIILCREGERKWPFNLTLINTLAYLIIYIIIDDITDIIAIIDITS